MGRFNTIVASNTVCIVDKIWDCITILYPLLYQSCLWTFSHCALNYGLSQKVPNTTLSISLPPFTWPFSILVSSSICLSLCYPSPLPLWLLYSPWSHSQSLHLPLHSLYHPMAKHTDLDSPVCFDVSDVTPALQMPLHRRSYPLREPAQPTERASH